MHYTDGTEARIGDIVQGRGSNLPYTIVGPVTKLIERDVCNILVRTAVYKHYPAIHDDGGGCDERHEFPQHDEYGQCQSFTLIYRDGWEHVPLTFPDGEIHSYAWRPKPL
jgi:hypothetical protein